jgi:hypothetical protein
MRPGRSVGHLPRCLSFTYCSLRSINIYLRAGRPVAFSLHFCLTFTAPGNRRLGEVQSFLMATLTTSSYRLYANTSTSSSFSCSTGCSYISFPVPELASWTSADTSLPVLRETQFIVDPNHNTTSTSVRCNSAALSAYRTGTLGGPEYYGLDDNCNLVATYGRDYAATVYVSLCGLE